MGRHHPKNDSGKNLKVAFFLNLGFTVFELIGGFYVNSIAIISDAFHDLGDSLSLGTSWYLHEKSKKKATREFSYGYGRFSLLGALINSIVLVAGSIYVVSEAVGRMMQPEPSNATGMLLFAIVGVTVNGYAALKLSKGKTMNERVVSWHLLEDVIGWSSILVVSVVLQFWENYYLDPALSLLITVYILWNVIKRLRETLFIFLQGHPGDVNKDEIEARIAGIANVHSLHHTHIWSLDGESHVFTTHVKLKKLENLNDFLHIKNKIKEILKDYPFEHYTIETEIDKETCGLKD
ncbi:MAG: cation diffusion facilitator family transporter [Bacteroidota bacterium]